MAAALVALGLLALLAPGLGEVRALLGRASPAWVAVAVALEVASSLSYVAMFRPSFCPRMSWRFTFEIALSELAVGSIVPASGATGVVLGAWALRRSGMPVRLIAQRSVAFLLIKSSVNFAAVVVIGVLLWLGIGERLSPFLTILPAGLAALTMVGVPLAAFWLASAGARRATGRVRDAAAVIRDGVRESGRLLRQRDAMLITGVIGYWIFDNLVLLASFHAIGVSPPVLIVLMAYLIGQLGGALPLPGGLGGIDGGLIGALIVYGIDPAPAAAAVLIYRVVLFWVPVLLGIPAFWSLRRGLNDAGRTDMCM